MRKIKILTTILCVTFMAFGMASSAGALTIDTGTLSPPVTLPLSTDPEVYTWGLVGNSNDTSTILTQIAVYYPTYQELWKVEYDNDVNTEEGMTESYDGWFTAHDGEVTHVDTTPYIGSTAYVLLKDGNAEPNWYFIELAGWDGTETLIFSNFFEGEFGGKIGAISHISLFGTSVVPEPATLILLGFGLLGLAGIRRK